MTPIQETLLEMIKEIETICHKNNIIYYLSGGSVIGAIRHKGFIPWDDDIDILMDRKNWERFLAAAKDSLPPGRKLECLELNEQFNNTVNKYVNTNTTNIHKNELLGDNCTGVVIDILLLDSIPEGEQYFLQYVKNLEIYSDLINDAYMYLLRWQFKIHYRFYRLLMKLFGRQRILDRIKKRLTQYTESECSKYVVAWGHGPTLFDKSVFGTPRYVPFEGEIELPLPEKAYEFARILYGFDWVNVPQHEEQQAHDTILSFDYLPADVYSRFYQYHTKNAVRNLYRKHKLMAVTWAANQNKNSYMRTTLEAYKVKAVLEKKIRERDIRPTALYSQGEYAQLRELFEEYVSKQCSRAYVGREIEDGLIRRYDPVFINISDELLYEILRLLMHDGELSKIYFILRARELGKETPLPAQISKVKLFLQTMDDAINLYDIGDFKGALNVLQKMEKTQQELCIVSKLKIRIWSLKLNTEREKCKKLLEKELSRFPNDGEFLKYYADIIYRDNGIQSAWRLYGTAFRQTRNGIIWYEIFQVLSSESPWFYKTALDMLEKGKTEEAGELLAVWGEIPNILNTSPSYQEVYFEHSLMLCEKEESLEELQRKIIQLWKTARCDKTSLEDAYRKVLERQGYCAEYPEIQIKLACSLPYTELLQLYTELSRKAMPNPQQRFLTALTAYQIGKTGEAFEALRRLWREQVDHEQVVAFLANDLMNQFIRMLRMKSNAAKEFFIAEWLVKYPDSGECADILINLGLIRKEHREFLQHAIEEMLTGRNYVRNLKQIAAKFYVDNNMIMLGKMENGI